MAKKRTHIGEDITEEDQRKLHEEHKQISPTEHPTLMRAMGISDAEDEAWHNAHGPVPLSQPAPERKSINPFAVGGAFLDYCVKQKWLIREGTGRSAKYYPTEAGIKELRNFDIKI